MTSMKARSFGMTWCRMGSSADALPMRPPRGSAGRAVHLPSIRPLLMARAAPGGGEHPARHDDGHCRQHKNRNELSELLFLRHGTLPTAGLRSRTQGESQRVGAVGEPGPLETVTVRMHGHARKTGAYRRCEEGSVANEVRTVVQFERKGP